MATCSGHRERGGIDLPDPPGHTRLALAAGPMATCQGGEAAERRVVGVDGAVAGRRGGHDDTPAGAEGTGRGDSKDNVLPLLPLLPHHPLPELTV